MMSASFHVAMGEAVACDDKVEILTTFVGSCVALCLYDPQAKIGGMAHIMLPGDDGKISSNSTNARSSPGKYADLAVETLVRLMVGKGAAPGRIVAKIAGGANMFVHESGVSLLDIGQRNANAVRRFLKQKAIPLVAEDIGMRHGRRVEFNIGSGKLIVRSSKDGERRL